MSSDTPNGVIVDQVSAVVHGRVLQRPAPRSPAPMLVGFHGYGEGATSLLEGLLPIPGVDAWQIAAPQGLHRFYRSRTGEVVASWMTSQDREEAIADNIRYIGAVVERLRGPGAEEPLVYAGFSQGVAMAYRAAAGCGHAAAGVIALGGDVPPELADRELPGFPPVLIGRGDAEEWYTAEKLAADVELLESKGVRVETCVYRGGHEWTDEFRRAAGEFLAGLS